MRRKIALSVAAAIAAATASGCASDRQDAIEAGARAQCAATHQEGTAQWDVCMREVENNLRAARTYKQSQRARSK